MLQLAFVPIAAQLLDQTSLLRDGLLFECFLRSAVAFKAVKVLQTLVHRNRMPIVELNHLNLLTLLIRVAHHSVLILSLSAVAQARAGFLLAAVPVLLVILSGHCVLQLLDCETRALSGQHAGLSGAVHGALVVESASPCRLALVGGVLPARRWPLQNVAAALTQLERLVQRG